MVQMLYGQYSGREITRATQNKTNKKERLFSPYFLHHYFYLKIKVATTINDATTEAVIGE